MKYASLFAFLLSAPFVLAAGQADTAYTALRVVGKQKGQGVLNKVVELRGRNGTPQPAVWKIILSDASARGGLREIEVQRGTIIAERTPTVRGASTQPMDFNRLNLDSEGVFTIVNQESEQAGQPFDRVDYVLRSGSGGGAPVWTAELFNGRDGNVATYQLAADSGSILSQSKSRTTTSTQPSNDRDFVTGNPPPRESQVYQGRSADGGYSKPGESFRSVPDFFHRLGKRMERRSNELVNFFSGKPAEPQR